MALSKEQKDALNDHFRDKDLYDPTKDPKQEVSTFEPKAMFAGGSMGAFCDGGTTGYADGGTVGGAAAETEFPTARELMEMPATHKGMLDGVYHSADRAKGYDDGGTVGPGDQSGYAADSGAADAPESAYITQDQAKQQAEANLASKVNANPLAKATFDMRADNPPRAPSTPPSVPQDAPGAPSLSPEQESAFKSALGAPSEPPAPSGDKLAPDQMAQLYAALTAKPTLGQGAMSGLAGLADAIETGVARAGNPGFQKNITEQQQIQKQNLANALTAKYRGQELGINQQRANDENTRAEKALSAEALRSADERKTQERGQDISAKTAAAEHALQAANQAREYSQASRAEDQKIVQEYSPLKPGGYTAAQRDAAAARLKAGGGAATPLTATNKMGHKIVSVDGGKTWKPMQ